MAKPEKEAPTPHITVRPAPSRSRPAPARASLPAPARLSVPAPAAGHDDERRAAMLDGFDRGFSQLQHEPPPRLEDVFGSMNMVEPPAVRESGAPSAELTSMFEKAIEDIASLRPLLLAHSERQLVELAALIAKRVIGRELEIDPAIVADLAREGLDALGTRDRVVVRLGAGVDDVTLEECVGRLRAHAPRCEVISDPALGPTDCIVETELGRVDESIETRLEQVLEAVFAAGTPIAGD
jgi:flagellar assembly protein FliH